MLKLWIISKKKLENQQALLINKNTMQKLNKMVLIKLKDFIFQNIVIQDVN